MAATALLQLAAALACLSQSFSSTAATKLFLTSKIGVFLLDENGQLLQHRNETFPWWQEDNIAANPRNGAVCWIFAEEDQDVPAHARCAPTTHLSAHWELSLPKHFNLNRVNAMEFEPDTGNWHITSFRTNYVCSSNFEECAKIGESGGNVRFYVAYDIPNRLIFIITTDGFSPYRMEVMNLDGSGRRQIADNSSIDYPTDLAVDSAGKKVYWTDRGHFGTAIYRCDYEGQNKEKVAQLDDNIANSHQRDLKIIGNSIFVMWGQQQRVSKIDKNTGEIKHLINGKILDGTTEIEIGQKTLLAMEVISDALQPQVENQCASNNGGCPQLCVPTVEYGRASHACVCRPGQELVDTACFKKESSTVVIVTKNSLQAVDIETEKTTTILYGLKNATKLDFFYQNENEYLLFWLDDGGLFRGFWRVGGQVSNIETLVPAGGKIRVVEVAVEWYQRNVIWIEWDTEVSSYQDDGMKLKIASVTGIYAKTLVTDNWRRPSGLIIQHEGINFAVNQDDYFGPEFKMWNAKGESDWFGFSGTMNDLKLGYIVHDIVNDLSALSDPEDLRYLWINPINGSIEATFNSLATSEKGKTVLFTHPSLKAAGGLDIYSDHIFWTDSSAGRLMTANSETGEDVRAFGISAKNPRGVRVLNPRKQPNTRYMVCDSENNGCSDMCVLMLVSYERTGVCLCPDGKTLGADERICE